MKVVNLQQQTPEWHAWRAAGIGASEAGIIAAGAGFVTPASWMDTVQELWEKKCGMRAEAESNYVMQRGSAAEADARDLYMQKTGILVAPICAEMDDCPIVRASFDGVTFEGDSWVELKAGSAKVHKLAQQGIVVPYYRPQMAHQGLVLHGHPDAWDRKAPAHFASYIPEIDELAIVEGVAGDYIDLAVKLFPELLKFWDMVEKGSAPCGDAWMQAAKRFILADLEMTETKASHEFARKAMISLLPAGKITQYGGDVRVTGVKSDVNAEALIADQQIEAEKVEQFRLPGEIDYKAAAETLERAQLETFRSPGLIDVDAMIEALGISPEIVEKHRGEPKSYRVTITKSKPKAKLDKDQELMAA